jgi:hypothetical protein
VFGHGPAPVADTGPFQGTTPAAPDPAATGTHGPPSTPPHATGSGQGLDDAGGTGHGSGAGSGNDEGGAGEAVHESPSHESSGHETSGHDGGGHEAAGSGHADSGGHDGGGSDGSEHLAHLQ